MICPNCGTFLQDGAKFCNICGCKLPEPAPERRRRPGVKPLVIVLAAAVLLCALGGVLYWQLGTGSEPDGGSGHGTTGGQSYEYRLPTAPAATATAEPTPSPTPEPTEVPTPSAEPEPVELSYSVKLPDKADRLYFVDAEASSEIYHDGKTYSAWCAIDDDHDTSWQEDVSGDGAGEYIVLYFKEATQVGCFTIFPGFDQSDWAWEANSRPSRLYVELSDGSSFVIELEDKRELMCFRFSEPVETEYLKFTILAAHSGSEWDDTAITEITPYA